jgi:hypothetical protein
MLSRERIFYVYALMDPRKPGPFEYGGWTFRCEPFYIGKGHGNRARSHLLPCLEGTGNTHKCNKIKRIRGAGLEPVVSVGLFELTERQALIKERHIIAAVGRVDIGTGPLTNWSSGGEASGIRAQRGLAVRRKMSKAQRRRFEDPEQRAHLAIKTKEWIQSNPTKHARASQARTETLRSEEYRTRASEITKRQHRENPESIRRGRARRQESVGKWSVAISRKMGGTPIRVYQEGKFYGKYETQNQAARAIGINSYLITLYLRGERGGVRGFTFKRVT